MTNLPYEANLNLRGGSLNPDISRSLSQTLGDVLGQVKQKTALSMGGPLNQVTFNQPSPIQADLRQVMQVNQFYNSLSGTGARVNMVV